MKTLIETKTGRIVNAGDVITLDGTAHILTDFDVPELVGSGVLSFACVEQFPKKDNTKTTTQTSTPDICWPTIDDIKEEIINEYPSIPQDIVIPIQIKHPKLQAVFYNWGYNKGLETEESIQQAIAILWHLHPQSLLQIALKELAEEWNEYAIEFYTGTVYGFSLATGNMVPVIAGKNLKFTKYLALFTEEHNAKKALTVVKELTDLLFYGE